MDKENQKSDMEFDYSTIPKFMQKHGKFCLWKLEMKSGKAKPEKFHIALTGKEPMQQTQSIIQPLKKL